MYVVMYTTRSEPSQKQCTAVIVVCFSYWGTNHTWWTWPMPGKFL